MRLKATVLGELAQIALGDGGCDTELADNGKPRPEAGGGQVGVDNEMKRECGQLVVICQF